MKKIILFISGVLVLSLVACTTPKNETTTKTIVTANSEMISLDKNQLVNNADAVIEGIVVSQEAQEDFKGFPVTDFFIMVEKVYLGNPDETVEVRIDSGESDSMILLPEEGFTPTFTKGERVVLFLSSNKGKRPDKEDFDYYVLRAAQGKFTVSEDGVLKNNTHSFTYDSFADEIKSLEAENLKNNLPKLFLPEGEESGI